MSVVGYVGQIHIGTNDYLVGSTLYGIYNVTNSEDIQTKTLVINGFSLASGLTVHIKFVQENRHTDPKLEIKSSANDDQATAIIIENANGPKTWAANSVIAFTLTGESAADYRWTINSSAIDGSSIQNLNLGYIQSNGTISQTNDITIENGDKLIISDANSTPVGKISRSSIIFDGSTESQVLSKKGTWVNMYTHPTDAGNKHIPSGGSTGQFLKYGGSSGTASWASFSNLILKIDTGTTEGTDLYTYNGNNAKTLDIKHSGNDITFTTAAGSLTIAHTTGDGHKHVPATGTTNNNKFLKAGATAGSLSWSSLAASDIPELDWSKITSGKPTTLSGYGITDAKIADGVVTLGSNTITPITSVNNKSGSSVTITAGDLGLAAALRFVGTTTSNISDGWTGVPAGISGYTTPIVGDVVLKGDAEYVCISVTGTGSNAVYTWELLGRDGSFALSTEVINKSVFNAAYQLLYSTGASSPTVLDPNTTSTRKFLRMVGNGTAGTAPEWDTVTKTDVGLSNVENTKLSTWTGSGNITTVGTITSGTWHGTAIEASYIGSHSTDKLTSGTLPIARGGTNISTYTKGDILYASDTNTLSKLSVGTNQNGYVLTLDSGVPAWKANQATDENVKQSPIAQNGTDANKEYAILFKNTHSAWTEETAGVKFTSTNDYRITINPSTGTLTAKNLIGALRAVDVKTALGYASDTANSSIIFLHKSGNWKTLSVGVGTAGTTGNVVVGATHTAGTLPTFSQGTLASASVSNGVLTLVSATADTFTQGAFPTLTLSKANVTISAS